MYVGSMQSLRQWRIKGVGGGVADWDNLGDPIPICDLSTCVMNLWADLLCSIFITKHNSFKMLFFFRKLRNRMKCHYLSGAQKRFMDISIM